VHDQLRSKLVASAEPVEADRLLSVTTLHAVDWTQGPNPWFTLTPEEVRYALRWCLGVPLYQAAYTCRFCGRAADAGGLHATACLATGAAARGHTVVKWVLGSVYRAAGGHVEFERSTAAHPERRPADLLVCGVSPRPLAIDVTVWSRFADGTDPLDKVVADKVTTSAAICKREGWAFRPWAADVYGAVHPVARLMVSKVARLVNQQRPLAQCGSSPPGHLVWRAVSAAVIARAASQHLRHALALSPLSWSSVSESDALGDSSVMPGDHESCAADEPVEDDDTADALHSVDMDASADDPPPRGSPPATPQGSTSHARYAHNPYSADGPVSLQEGFVPPSLSQSQLAGVAWLRGRLPPPPCEADGDDEET